jgi:UDP-3-O-[3-hydroxymyristoyl] glucosamine N-acyltransferase
MLWLIEYFYPSVSDCEPGIHATAIVSDEATLGKDVSIGAYSIVKKDVHIGDGSTIGPYCQIGANTTIGNNCRFVSQVTVMHNVTIGNNVILHPNVVVGADGYKYEQIDGKLTRIPQVGTVVIEDDVEVGACSCIDRATLSETRIGQGTKLDNLVQIGHNVVIGKNCLIISQVGIAGSTTIGDNCILAGQVGIADNVRIGDNAILGAKAGVNHDIPAGAHCLGSPAVPVKQFARMTAALKRLPDMTRSFNKMSSRVDQLIDRQDSGVE